MSTKALTPTYTADLFAPLHAELMGVLHSLREDAWYRSTVAGDWLVRDVAAHLLDGDVRAVSAIRDRYMAQPEESIEGYDDLVRFLNRMNAEWITATRRLSPQVLTDLLAATGRNVADTFRSLPPHERAPFAVAWAGEDASENWMHVGREYTERWHHQMQVRDAVGAPGLFDRRWFLPLLELSLRALPHAYRWVEAVPESCIAIEVAGTGSWSLVRQNSDWVLFRGAVPSPATFIRLDSETAWRSLYNALAPAYARMRADVEGDEALAAPFFAARSVMV